MHMQKKTKQDIPPELIDERATLNKKSPNMSFKNVISFSLLKHAQKQELSGYLVSYCRSQN